MTGALSPRRHCWSLPAHRASASGAGFELLVLALALACGAPERAERAVIVTIDTLRADHVGVYGAGPGRTPAIDALAEGGVRFEVALSPVPLTLPAHATLFTALDPPEHGVRSNSTFRLPEDVPTLAEKARGGGIATAAFVAAAVLDRRFGLARGFDVYDDETGTHRSGRAVGFAERPADEVVDAALAWVDHAPSRFLLWVHLYDPHREYAPPLGFRLAYPGHPYRGEIAFADHQVGRLTEGVRARWPDNRTLFVVTSDHGESLGQHGEATHGYFIYEATQRIPLVMAGAGVPSDRVVSSPVSLADVAPTVSARLGVSGFETTAGRDLAQTWDGSNEQSRALYLETLAPRLDFGWSPLLGLRTEEWKYVRAPTPELYALEADPHEQENLAERHPDRVASLDRELETRLVDSRVEQTVQDLGAEDRARLESLGYVIAEPVGRERPDQVGGLDPKDAIAGPVLRLGAAEAALAEGRPETALREVAGLTEGGQRLEVTRAQAALMLQDGVAAEAYANAALALGPGLPWAYSALAEALLLQDRVDEAAEVFEKLERIEPGSSAALAGRGWVAERGGELDRAVALYEAATASRAPVPEAFWRLAALRIEAGEDADSLLDQVSPSDLEEPAAALRLARAHVAAGSFGRARTILETAREHYPEVSALAREIDSLPAD